MMQLEWESSPEFRRCTWGVLWRISHVHEVLHILWGKQDRERDNCVRTFGKRSKSRKSNWSHYS